MRLRAVCIAVVMVLTAGIGGYAGIVRAGEGPVIEGSARKLNSVLGCDVTTRPEGDIGRVVDVLIDADGKVSAAVVEFGGFLGIGTRKIAVDWGAFQVVSGSLVVDVTREQLRGAKDYKMSEHDSALKAIRGN